jgi:hypothetical protein
VQPREVVDQRAHLGERASAPRVGELGAARPQIFQGDLKAPAVHVEAARVGARRLDLELGPELRVEAALVGVHRRRRVREEALVGRDEGEHRGAGEAADDRQPRERPVDPRRRQDHGEPEAQRRVKQDRLDDHAIGEARRPRLPRTEEQAHDHAIGGRGPTVPAAGPFDDLEPAQVDLGP